MKRCRQLLAIGLIGLLLWVPVGCQKEQGNSSSQAESSLAEPEPDPNWPVTAGEVTLQTRPQQVISLSPALTEAVCELTNADRLAGVSSFCDYPSEVTDLPDCGTAQMPNREQIEALKPELVLVSAALPEEVTVWLEGLGAQVVVLPRAESLEELEERYRTLGLLLEGKEAGEELAQATFDPLWERYDALCAAADQVEQRVSGIYLRQAPLLMATGDTLEGKLLEILGIENDAADYTNWEYPQEQAVNLYPDLIFYDSSIPEEYFASTQVYSTTDAYLKKRLYPVEGIVFERQSERMFDQLEEMFQLAYPEIPLSPVDGMETSEESEPADDGMLNLEDATQVE